MRPGAAAPAIAIALALGAPRHARGDAPVRLDVSGDVCDPAPLRARVDELLARHAFVDDRAEVDESVVVDVVAAGDRVHGTIALRDRAGVDRGQRTIDAADCNELTEAAALVIALVLSQPVATTAPEPPSRVDAIEPEVPLSLDAAPAPRGPYGGEVFAGVAGGRAGDAIQGAVVIGGGLRRGSRSLGLELQLAAPGAVAVGPGRVVVATGTFELGGCLHRGVLAGCATAAAGWVRGRGEDLPVATTATTPYAAAGLRLGVEPELSERIGVRIQLAARVPLTRNRFLVDEMAVWSTSAVEVWLGLVLVARIP